MVRSGSLFSQLIALFRHQQFYRLVAKLNAERYAKALALGIILFRCCSVNWPKLRASEIHAEDWPAA